MSKLGDEPAYPVFIDGVRYPGLTKREKIAALQLQALVIHYGFSDEDTITKDALLLADALLARLSKESSSC